jgi:quinol monooxygenase YgiN
MFLVHVHVKVRPEKVEEFIAATKENAKNSLLEPGVILVDPGRNRSQNSGGRL